MKRVIVIGSPGVSDRIGKKRDDIPWTEIGKKRDDIPWTEHEFDEEFRQFIVEFPEARLPGIYQLLHQYEQGREIHIFRSREEAEEYLAEAGG